MAWPQMQALIEQYTAAAYAEAQAMQASPNGSSDQHTDELRWIDAHITQLQEIHAMAVALQRQTDERIVALNAANWRSEARQKRLTVVLTIVSLVAGWLLSLAGSPDHLLALLHR